MATYQDSTMNPVKQEEVVNKRKCAEHGYEPIRHFCDSCGIGVCPDCMASPSHSGHNFCPLNDIADHQKLPIFSALTHLIKLCQQIKKQHQDAVKQTQQRRKDLDESVKSVKSTLDQLKEEYIDMLDAELAAQVDAVDEEHCKRTDKLLHSEKELNQTLVNIDNACKQGNDLLQTESEQEIASVFPSLILKLGQLVASEIPTVDAAVSYIEFKSAPVEMKNLGTLVCQKEQACEAEAISQEDEDDEADLSLCQSLSRDDYDEEDGENQDDKVNNNSLDLKEAEGELSPTSSKPKSWQMTDQFTTMPKAEGPKCIAVHRNGDIAVTSWGHVIVFDQHGKFKFVLKGSPSHAEDIDITKSNEYIIPGSAKIEVYNSRGKKNIGVNFHIPSVKVNGKLRYPRTIAVDKRGFVFVGLSGSTTVLNYRAEGGPYTSKFNLPKPPRNLAITSQDEVVASLENDTLQVMEKSGGNARVILPPPSVRAWKPYNLCCSKKGELFVCSNSPRAVYRYKYSFVDGEYHFADCVTSTEGYPYGISLSMDERKVFVVDTANNSVKVFQYQ